MRILVRVNPPSFFANAGQAEVERGLVGGLIEAGVDLTLGVDAGSRLASGRLRDWLGESLRDGRVSIQTFEDFYAGGRTDFDIVIFHALSDLVRYGTRMHSQVVGLVHSLELLHPERVMLQTLGRGLTNFRLPPVFVAPSNCTARRLRWALSTHGAQPKVAVVPWGCAPAEGPPTPAEAREEVEILSIARISPQKQDYFQLVSAVALATRGSRARLHLLGGVADSDKEYARDVERHACREGVPTTLGVHASAEQKADALGRATAFVTNACNAQESFGIALREAVGAGLPSVVPSWNGFRECSSELLRFLPTVASHTVGMECDWQNDKPGLTSAATVPFGRLVRAVRGVAGVRPRSREAPALGSRTWPEVAADVLAAAEGRLPHSGLDRVELRSPVDGLADFYLPDVVMVPEIPSLSEAARERAAQSLGEPAIRAHGRLEVGVPIAGSALLHQLGAHGPRGDRLLLDFLRWGFADIVTPESVPSA